MKVTNWRRKLAASLVAGGLLAPSALYATDINTNILTDGGFEDVSATTCCFGANKLNSWTGGTQPGFAYAYSLAYDNGNPLASGGNYYFTTNGDDDGANGATDVNAPGKVSQVTAITPGSAATQIAGGEAAALFSAYFSSYQTDGDYGHVQIEFLNSTGGSLGKAEIDGSDDTSTWLQRRSAVLAPVGTASLRTSVFGTALSGGPDGYIDNVDVRIVPAQDELLYLEVNVANGNVAIRNQSGDPFRIDYYEITAGGPAGDYNNNGIVDAADYTLWRDNLNTSATLPNDTTPGVTQNDYNVWKANFGSSGSSLDPVDWLGLQEQTVAGFPAGNGTGNGWEQAGGASGTVLSESYLTGNSNVVDTANIGLGAAFNPGSPHNLQFRYSVVKDDGMGNFVGPGSLVSGFVRYVGGSGAISAVPEPSSVLLVGLGLSALLVGSGRSKRDQ